MKKKKIGLMCIIIAGVVVLTMNSQALGKARYEGITLTYLATSPMVTSDLDREFEKLTGAKIEVITVSWPDLHPKLVTSFAAKSPTPDLYIAPDEWSGEFGKAGWFVPLEDHITEEDKTDVLQIAWDMYTYEGHLTALPQMVMPVIMFCNKKMLSEAGYEPAETWDEFVSQSKTLMATGMARFGITWPLLSGDDMSFDVFHVILLSMGGQLFDKNGNPVFNNKTGIEALQFFVDTLYKSRVASRTSVEVEKMESLRPFMAGENPYNLNWQFMYPITIDPEKSAVAEYSKYCLVPRKKSDISITGFVGGGALGINPYSKHIEAAIEYARFIVDKEKAIENFQKKGWMPWWKSFYVDPRGVAVEPQLPMLLKQMQRSTYRPSLSWYAEFAETMRTELAKAYLEERSPKDVLDSTAKIVKEKLEEYGW